MSTKLTGRLTVLTVLSLAACGTGPRNSIAVDGNIPLTGPIASFSGQYSRGFSMGLDEAAKALNVDRKIFKEDFQDNAGKTTTAVSVMRQQLVSRPDIYVSGTSAMSDAILSEVNRLGVPHFLVAFDAFMTEASPNAIRVLPHFKIEAPIFLDFIRDKKAKRVFFFTPNLKAYLDESDKLILPKLKAAGVDYKRELFEFETKDFRTIAEKAATYNPDVIVISGYAFHVYPVIRALRELKLVDRARVISTLDFIDLIHGNVSRDDLKGIWFTSPECEIPNKIPGYQDWKNRFAARYSQQPSYVDAYAYDTARIIVKAYHDDGRKVDIASLLKATPFEGIVGRIVLDNQRDLDSTLVVGYVNPEGLIEEYPKAVK
jgi:branched-chain amino acid transport system substrate-binding protein